MVGICSDLPEEMLGEIFLWLTLESLIRFKCVSTSWCDFIKYLTKNPALVNKQLHNIGKKSLFPTCLVFYCPEIAYWGNPEAEMESLGCDLFRSITVQYGDNELDDINNVSEVFHLPTHLNVLDLVFSLRSHCNGIICLAYPSAVILCNPAINEWRTLPTPCLTYRGFLVQGMGFGYNLKANDFKIVRFGHDRSLDGVDYYKTSAEVYSMRSNSWRECEIQFKFDCIELGCSKFTGKEIFCNGVFYWPIRSKKQIILSFDTFDEVFRSIPLPDDLLVVQKDHFIRLAVWNETVALFSYKREKRFTKSIEVWVMNDCCGGVKGSSSWSKKLIIRPPVDTAFPLAFLNNDEVLMLSIDARLVLYNLYSQTVKSSSFVGRDSDCDWEFSYAKSLLSVQGVNQSRS